MNYLITSSAIKSKMKNEEVYFHIKTTALTYFDRGGINTFSPASSYISVTKRVQVISGAKYNCDLQGDYPT